MTTKNKRTNKLSNPSRLLFNDILELNWDNPYITMRDIQEAQGLQLSKLKMLIAELVNDKRLLVGIEDCDGDYKYTYTPILKGGNSYGYPVDFFKNHGEFIKENKLEADE